MADQNAIRAAIQIDGDSSEGFFLCLQPHDMDELTPLFEEEDSYSNGPAWEGIAEYLINQDPSLEEIELDSEGDALLAYCARREPLEKLQAILIEVASDEQKLRNLIHDAREAGFGYGDL